MTISICALVPCFNEEGRIGKTIDLLLAKGSRGGVDAICVVDDGSSDNSLVEIRERDVDLVSYSRNKGKGYAIRQGIKYFLKTEHDVIIFIDADGQHNPNDIIKFKRKFIDRPEVDVVVASRFGTEEWLENMPFIRKISNLLSRFGMWVLYNGMNIEDSQNGFRAYRRRAIKIIKFNTNGYEAETEILIDAYLKGFEIDKVYVESIYSEVENHSKFSIFFDTWKIPGVMVKGFFKFKPFLYRTQENKLVFRKMIR